MFMFSLSVFKMSSYTLPGCLPSKTLISISQSNMGDSNSFFKNSWGNMQVVIEHATYENTKCLN